MQRFSEEQWRTILELADAAADLSPQPRRVFLESSGAPVEIINEVLLLTKEFEWESDSRDRVGTTIGRFSIAEYCGSGGVGDVYRAYDSELGRAVALKFLRPIALEQEGAVDRFIHEAQLLSALNHPNIVTVYEMLRSGEDQAIVMEFVEGTPLRTLCAATSLSFRDIVAIVRQIALALAAAHQRNIVHRDIKPENIIVGFEGSVKVLDFGLAKSLLPRREGDGKTISTSHLFAGTWRYMSPEQSRGETVTTATDIFSLGLVLHELITKRIPAGVQAEVNLSGPGSLSATLHALSVAKVPGRLRPLLRSMLSEVSAERPAASAIVGRLTAVQQDLSTQGRRPLIGASLLACAICLLAILYVQLRTHSLVPLVATAICVESGWKSGLSLSPDGNRVAYAWIRESLPYQIYVQSIDEQGTASAPVRLTHERWDEGLPAWSPDNRHIAFIRNRGADPRIVIRDLTTSQERTLTSFSGTSLSWTGDGKWLMAATGRLRRHVVSLISPENGKVHLLTPNNDRWDVERPASALSGRAIIFTKNLSNLESRLATLQLRLDGKAGLQSGNLSWPDFRGSRPHSPVYSATGSDLFFIAQIGDIRHVYRSHAGQTPVLLGELGEQPVDLAAALHRNRLAYLRDLGDTNVWAIQLKSTGSSHAGKLTRVVVSSRMDQRPAISPDGSQIAFESNRSGYFEIWLANRKGGEAVPLTKLQGFAGSPCWSPDGQSVVFDGNIENKSGLFRLTMSGSRLERLSASSTTNDVMPVVSDDGKWIYYTSNRAGRIQIWRMGFDGTNPTPQADSDSTAPQVSADGRFLYYQIEPWVPSKLWRKDLITGQTKVIAKDVLFRGYAVGARNLYIVQKVGTAFHLLKTSLNGACSRYVATLPSTTISGISVDRNEDTLFFAQNDSYGNEVMFVNNF